MNPGPFVQSSELFLGFVKLFYLQSGQHREFKACNLSLITIKICHLVSIERTLSLMSLPDLCPHSLPIPPLCCWGKRSYWRGGSETPQTLGT